MSSYIVLDKDHSVITFPGKVGMYQNITIHGYNSTLRCGALFPGSVSSLGANSVMVWCCPNITNCKFSVENFLHPNFILCSPSTVRCPDEQSSYIALANYEGRADLSVVLKDSEMFDVPQFSSAVGLDFPVITVLGVATLFFI